VDRLKVGAKVADRPKVGATVAGGIVSSLLK
jgi:hypothetical protein